MSETELQVLCPCLCQKPVTYKHCVIGLLSETCQLKHCVLACMRSVSYKHCVRDPSVTSTVSLPESEIRPLQALCPCLCQRSVSYKHCVLACVRNLSVTSTVSLPVSETRQLQALCPCLCQRSVSYKHCVLACVRNLSEAVSCVDSYQSACSSSSQYASLRNSIYNLNAIQCDDGGYFVTFLLSTLCLSFLHFRPSFSPLQTCLLYTSDAADER